MPQQLGKENGDQTLLVRRRSRTVKETFKLQRHWTFQEVRCGTFDEGETQLPSLSDITRWIAVSWKGVFGINIYEMANNMFLFEFTNRHMAEQIVPR